MMALEDFTSIKIYLGLLIPFFIGLFILDFTIDLSAKIQILLTPI